MAASMEIKKHLMFKTTGNFIFESWKSTSKTSKSTIIKVPQISAEWSITITNWDLPGLHNVHKFVLTLETKNSSLITIETSETGRFIALVDINATLNRANTSIQFDNDQMNEVGKTVDVAKKMEWLGHMNERKNGRLVVSCTLSIFYEFEERSLPIWIAPTNHLETDIPAILADDELKDFTLKVDDQVFKVHKFVLARASPVFKRLFTWCCNEMKHSAAWIEDCKPEVCQHLLHFIYSENPPKNLRSVSMDLYALAHRFDIPRLQELCLADIMEIKMNDENSLKLYEFAVKFDLKDLLRDAWEYIKNHLLEIDGTCGPRPLENIEKLLKAKEDYEAMLRSFMAIDCEDEL